MSFTDFGFADPAFGFGPFANLPGLPLLGAPSQSGFTMPGISTADPLAQAAAYAQRAPETFSTEGSVGGEVNPLSPGLSNKTNAGFGAAPGGGTADTDVSAAAKKKESELQKVLKGLKAPPPPQQQSIRSPQALGVHKVNSSMATLLASMGVSPAQVMRLTGGR